MSLKGTAMTDKVLRGKIKNIHQIEEIEALYAEAEELIERAEVAAELYEKAAQSAGELKTAFSNALKGSASGNHIVLPDVSPLEHELKVQCEGADSVTATGKNLFNVNALQNSATGSLTNNGDGTLTLIYTTINGGGLASRSTLKDVCPLLKVGDKVVLSLVTNSDKKIIYLDKSARTWPSGNHLIVSQDDLDSLLLFYTQTQDPNATGFIYNIQVEYGTTATEYEPYVEPTTYTTDENGKVAIPSIYPTTVLSADCESIAAEYNRDINKAFAELSAAILNS